MAIALYKKVAFDVEQNRVNVGTPKEQLDSKLRYRAALKSLAVRIVEGIGFDNEDNALTLMDEKSWEFEH